MVARDPEAQKGVIMNKLVPANEAESKINKRSQKIRNTKKLINKQSVFKTPPTAEETDIIHELFLNTLDPNKSTFHSRVKPEGTVWMENTRLKNLIICHPQVSDTFASCCCVYFLISNDTLSIFTACKRPFALFFLPMLGLCMGHHSLSST